MEASFFTRNRKKLLEKIDGGVVVMAAYTSLQRSNDAAFAFQQEANFWYLTGIEMPDWQLVVDGNKGEHILIAPAVDEVHELFDGSLSVADALATSGVDRVLSREEGESYLNAVIRQRSAIYTLGEDPQASHYNFVENPAGQQLRDRIASYGGDVKDCRQILARLRAIKQPEEIALHRQAINATVEAFDKVHQQFSTYRHEYEIEADFSHYFRSRYAADHAYDPIVAAGQHACTLHYVQNNGAVSEGDMVLIDIGARKGGYAADITRTYVVGSATERQRAVHEAVRSAHAAIIRDIRPGLSIKLYHENVDTHMKQALIGLGLLESMDDEAAYQRFFPHAISHGLGIDVHDSLGRPSHFEQGMILTVEPGIYLPDEGIGVRLEDDILVTDTGCENLSTALSLGL